MTTSESTTVSKIEETSGLQSDEREVRIDLDLDSSEITAEKADLEANKPTQPIPEETNLNIDTTEATETLTTLTTDENETSTHTYDIVTFGINPDGSIFYNNEKLDETPDGNIADFIAAVEDTASSDKQGSIEHIFQ